MTILSAEVHFRRGLAALSSGDPAEAASQFRAAIQVERQHSVTRPQMRYVSYFGLALAMDKGPTGEAIKACERAARFEFFNADLQLNLGKVYLLSGKTTRALMAFERGLRLAPRHKALRAELAKVDRRRGPVVPWLGRAHLLNKILGKVRHSMSQRGLPRVASRRTVTPS